MRKEILLLKYGEVVMKGLNRSYFDGKIIQRVKYLLSFVEGTFETEYSQSTLCVRGSDDADMDGAFEAAKKVFGIATVCRGFECEKNMEDVLSCIRENVDLLLSDAKTFKCAAKRSDKSFPLSSPEISMKAGGEVLSARPDMAVDVHDPEAVIVIEIRDRSAFVHGKGDKGAGGMPVGTAGSGLLLLSGGIDSPVAGYMMAKRGMKIDAVYFESPPYTSEAALEKVRSLAKLLSGYCGRIHLHAVSVTEIQEVLMNSCEQRMFTILLRRFMVRLAGKIAREYGQDALITGESIGQVASQTINAIQVTDKVADIPVFRPCIGMDKEEIVQLSRRAGFFETSILPYEDCCTVFTPKHPNLRPTTEEAFTEESKIDVEGLVERAYAARRSIKV